MTQTIILERRKESIRDTIRQSNIIAQKRGIYIFTFTPVLLQSLLYIFLYPILKFFGHVKVVGLENVKEIKGRVIFASNHISEWDPVLIRASLPFLWKNSPMYYASRSKQYYPKEVFGWKTYIYGGLFFKLWGAYPVHQGLKNYHKSLMNHLRILELDKSICVFPEGKISKTNELHRARGGVAYLSYETKAPVVPVKVEGLVDMSVKDFLLGRRKIRIAFGKPITKEELFTENVTSIGDFAKKAQEIMDQVAKL